MTRRVAVRGVWWDWMRVSRVTGVKDLFAVSTITPDIRSCGVPRAPSVVGVLFRVRQVSNSTIRPCDTETRNWRRNTPSDAVNEKKKEGE